METPRILLVQIREEPELLADEKAAFVKHSGLDATCFTCLRVFHDSIDPACIATYDAVMIGGSSNDPRDKLVRPREEYPFIDKLFDLIRNLIKQKIPTLMSCQGFYFLTQVMGGELVFDESRKENDGTSLIYVDTDIQDPLLAGLPHAFHAVSVHNKSAKEIPPACINLMWSDACPIHMLKVIDAPVYATQFHPELSKEEVDRRLLEYDYRKKYYTSPEQAREFIAGFADTTVANSLVRKFVEEIVKQ